MLTVDHFARIRQRRRDGLTVRQIAAELGHSPKTVLKALADPEPRPFRSPPRAAPVFGPFRAVVDAIVAADADAPPKQRHTASQIFRRLPLDTVAQAVAHQLARGDPTAPAVAAAADRLSVGVTRPPPNAPAVTVPRPDLARFNQLLMQVHGCGFGIGGC